MLAFVVVLATIIVTDGDTFSIDGERIRPVGFDAPELGRARCVAERMFGLLAKKRFEELMNSPTLDIRRIRCKTSNGPRCEDGIAHDVYRRTLARVFVQGVDVGDIMIREGYARKYNQKFRGKWCK